MLSTTQTKQAKFWLLVTGATIGALAAVVLVGGVLRFIFGGQGYAFLLTAPTMYGMWWAWHWAWQTRRQADLDDAQLIYASRGQRLIRVNWARFIAFQQFQVISSAGRVLEHGLDYSDIQKLLKAQASKPLK